MHTYKKLLVLTILGMLMLGFSGCASWEKTYWDNHPETKIRKAFIGKSENQVIRTFGVPYNSYETGDKKYKYLTYFYDAGVTNIKPKDDDSPCLVVFNLQKGKVTDFKFDERCFPFGR